MKNWLPLVLLPELAIASEPFLPFTAEKLRNMLHLEAAQAHWDNIGCATLLAPGHELGEAVLLPGNLLRSGEETLLDDLTVSDLQAALKRPVLATDGSGGGLLHQILEGGWAP